MLSQYLSSKKLLHYRCDQTTIFTVTYLQYIHLNLLLQYLFFLTTVECLPFKLLYFQYIFEYRIRNVY